MGGNRRGLPDRMGWNIVQGDAVGVWVAERTTGAYHCNSTAIGLERDGKIVAGVIYENFLDTTINCHVAIDGRMNKRFLLAVFDYPFRVCNVEKLVVLITEENAKIVRMAKNSGFTEEARIKRSNGDMIFFTMLKSECRFLGGKYG